MTKPTRPKSPKDIDLIESCSAFKRLKGSTDEELIEARRDAYEVMLSVDRVRHLRSQAVKPAAKSSDAIKRVELVEPVDIVRPSSTRH